MYSPDLQSKIALWRQKSAEGSMTVVEYREAIEALRAGRLSAAESSKAKKQKKVAEPIEEGDLLEGL
jgi:hypothetical protein